MISRVSFLKEICQARIGLLGSPFRPALAAEVSIRTHKASRQFRILASLHNRLQQEHAIQNPSDISFELITDILNNKPSGFITGVRTSSNGESVMVEFHDTTFAFHTQWLHDAQVDNGPAKDAAEAFLQNPLTARIQNASIAGHGVRATLCVTWNNGRTSQFPAIWLWAFAPLVAKRHGEDVAQGSNAPKGWLTNTLTIPEISYAEIIPENSTSKMSPTTAAWVYDALLHEYAAGIVKVVGLPAPVVEAERNTENTLVTRILKQIFGSVFVHPRRGPNTSFNIASHHEKTVKKGIALPNYNTNQILLPHVDQSHYTYPARIQGLYALEGESKNTFVSCPAVLATFQEETPHLFKHLCTAPMSFGRVAHFYTPPLYQATVDTAITMEPGFPGRIKRFRWHPHLTGSLLSPYDKFPEARIAHRKFQEIMRRDTHQLKVAFNPGDLYIWDSFRLLHGRELVFKVPRTSVGQTVPEQVVADQYRVLKMRRLMEYMDEKWLIHMPQSQLNNSVDLVDAWESLNRV